MGNGAETKFESTMAGKPRILIVEDEMPVALMMTYLLTQAGCETEVATTGAKAIQMALEQKFDLITLDVDLPDINGFEICNELKQRHFSRRTPVVFVSGRPCEQEAQRGLELGAADYIGKPFDVSNFIYRIIYHAKARTRQVAGPVSKEAEA